MLDASKRILLASSIQPLTSFYLPFNLHPHAASLCAPGNGFDYAIGLIPVLKGGKIDLLFVVRHRTVLGNEGVDISEKIAEGIGPRFAVSTRERSVMPD